MHRTIPNRGLYLGMGGLLVLQLLSFGLQPTSARADMAAGHLIIDQIDWAGTVTNPSDQWVEVYNPTTQPVDLSHDPYTLQVGGTTLATLNSGTITPGQYLVLSRLNPADPSANSALSSSLSTQVTPSLVLPNANAQYQLSDGTNTDLANPAMGAPFAGSTNASELRVIDSMGQYLPGDQSAAWTTTQTIGRNISVGSDVMATPNESSSVDVSTPTGVTVINPASDRPTVMANFPSSAPYGIVRFINTNTGQVVNGVGDTVSGYQPAVPLQAGSYTISVAAATTPDGDRSPAISLPMAANSPVVPVGPSNPTATVITAPVLDPYSSQTNAKTITLTGSVQPGTVSVSATANGTTVSEALNGMTTFALTLPLLTNAGTDIQIKAVAADGSLSQPTTAQVMQSTVAPSIPAGDHLLVASNAPGTDDTVSGQPGAVQSGSVVRVFADPSLTRLIGQATALPDGSFPAISLGDNSYAMAYVVQQDLAGNSSAALEISNPIGIANQNLNLPISVTNITSTSATVQLNPMPGVSQFLIKYRMTGGQYAQPVMVCAVVAPTCSLSKQISGLSPNTGYDIAVAAVDGQGAMSNYSETSFQTAQVQPVVAPVTASAPASNPVQSVGSKPPVQTTPAPVAMASPTAMASASPTVSPSPSASETGDVKSAATTRNWTPWIVLGLLIGLAILATSGYFYWFGGEAGAAMDAAASPTPVTPKDDASVNKTEDRPTKRW